jgi:hypothetical protein
MLHPDGVVDFFLSFSTNVTPTTNVSPRWGFGIYRMFFLQMLHPSGVVEFYDVRYLQISLQLEQSKLLVKSLIFAFFNSAHEKIIYFPFFSLSIQHKRSNRIATYSLFGRS